MEKVEAKKEQRKDWADFEDDADQEEEIGAKAEAVKEVQQPKKVKATGPKPQKNSQGDFVVTTINVEATMNLGRKKATDSDDEDKNDDKISLSDDLRSDSGNDEEEEKEADKVQEKEEAKPKQLSKKEQEAAKDAEFAALLGDVKLEPKEEVKEEKKPAAAAAQAGENNSKNRKKKEKKKAQAAEAAKVEEEKKEEEPVDAAAAAKAALAKRAGKAGQAKAGAAPDRSGLAAQIKAEKEKAGKKKEKKYGATSIF